MNSNLMTVQPIELPPYWIMQHMFDIRKESESEKIQVPGKCGQQKKSVPTNTKTEKVRLIAIP